MDSTALPWTDLIVRIPAKPLLTHKEVELYLEIGEHALDDLISAGQFPRPILLSPKTPRWRSEWIRWFLDARELGSRLLTDENFDRFGPVSSGLGGFGPVSSPSGGKRPVEKKDG